MLWVPARGRQGENSALLSINPKLIVQSNPQLMHAEAYKAHLNTCREAGIPAKTIQVFKKKRQRLNWVRFFGTLLAFISLLHHCVAFMSYRWLGWLSSMHAQLFPPFPGDFLQGQFHMFQHQHFKLLICTYFIFLHWYVLPHLHRTLNLCGELLVCSNLLFAFLTPMHLIFQIFDLYRLPHQHPNLI